jgi:hypothetical protein
VQLTKVAVIVSLFFKYNYAIEGGEKSAEKSGNAISEFEKFTATAASMHTQYCILLFR